MNDEFHSKIAGNLIGISCDDVDIKQNDVAKISFEKTTRKIKINNKN